MEVNQLLNELPRYKIYRDGDEKVKCVLTMLYDKRGKGRDKWCIGYFSFENDYWLMVGRGETLNKAVDHLKRQL